MNKMDTNEDLITILKKIEKDSISTKGLREEFSEVLEKLRSLEKSGLIKREGTEDKISSCKWFITSEGKSFIKLNETYSKIKNYEVILTLPPPFKKSILEKHPNVVLTDEAIKKMLIEAKEKIRILSPYVDASVIDYMKAIQKDVKINFLTTLTPYGKNTILERLKQDKEFLEVKYITEKSGNIQKFQTHAKIMIIDNSKVYVGSANFKDTSMLYNLEAGIILSQPEIVNEYVSIFDDIYVLVGD